MRGGINADPRRVHFTRRAALLARSNSAEQKREPGGPRTDTSLTGRRRMTRRRAAGILRTIVILFGLVGCGGGAPHLAAEGGADSGPDVAGSSDGGDGSGSIGRISGGGCYDGG